MSLLVNRTRNHKKIRSTSQAVTYAIVFVIFAMFALSYIMVLVWSFVAGLKTHNDVIMRPFGLPDEWHFEHYIEVFTLLKVGRTNFFGMLFNSLYFSLLGPLISGMVTCLLAYAISKYRFPGSKLFYPVIMLVTLMPISGNGGAVYRLYYDLGLINSYSQIITSFVGMNFNCLLYYAAFKNLSNGYSEAAFIDGANDFQVFFKVMFPQVFNVFGALFLLAWVASWNDYSTALVYLPKMPTIASGIYSFELEMRYNVRIDILFAAYTISAIPPLLLFAFFSNVLTSNISLGGLKE